tara:strand:- start:7516 stop:8895 length:1380 start_codon:yes stop_codon:yes gene_type:complete
MDLNYTPIHGTTRNFHKSDKFGRWLMGPLGCGKSYAIAWEILIRASQQPVSKYGTRRCRVIFVRNTRQMLKDTVLPILQDVFPDGVMGHWRESDSIYQVRIGDIHLDILLRPLEDVKDIRRVLSINATFCVIDEWRELPVSIINDIVGRAGRFPPKEEEGCTYAGIFGASNPPGEDSDWYETIENKQPKGWEVFKFPSARSSEATWKKFLIDGYYERLIDGATDDYIRVMIDGKYGRSLAGRPVYENTFRHDFHVAKEPLLYLKDKGYTIVIGMDFGRTPGAVFGQRDPSGRILVLSELYKENIGLEKFIQDYVKPHLNELYPGMPVRVVGDPAGWAKTQINELCCADVLTQNNITSVKAPTNDPEMRIEGVERVLVRQLDGKPYFIIDPSCKMIIRGFNGGYKYKRRTDGTYDPKPMKDKYSHLADAVQYLIGGVDGLGGGLVQTKAMKIEKRRYRYV